MKLYSFDEGKELGASCQVQIDKMLGSGAHLEHEINNTLIHLTLDQIVYG